ncbi:hypothetical protein QAO71_17285 (plasmid) [Halopseudomonas sp. SMJS2]|uniref:hypothetical protein n=1 Tax=Halopseudomonas sp. SMJS2 TaxID=3041098 RepID=UPI002452EA83|nr:hypothetical protein [Halopseudomonas sp. SMJS2]WGK63522.1 hypothetical protein QAO71_17285 [Halopseudomonas sp. SMJS2]
MGRLILLVLPLMMAADIYAQSLPQTHQDAIREHHTKQIMGSGKNITVLQPDVLLYRSIFERKNTVQQRQLIDPDPVPWAQVFKNVDLSFGHILTLAALASGYDAHFDGNIDPTQIVQLNTQANSMVDLAEYLSRVTGTQITVYPESRVIVASARTTP